MLIEQIEKRISDYLEFDVKEIFEQGDQITIFGGAVRDSIANLEINDVDILCMSESAINLSKFIKKYNYTPVELYDLDATNMYKNIQIISEPWTFINNNKKIIQIIRPIYRYNSIDYYQSYNDLIKNVDISCCGVFIEPASFKLSLKEAYRDAIGHCIAKVFVINKSAKMYNYDRTTYREYKLDKRGWKNLDNLKDEEKKQMERKMKLFYLEGEKFNKTWDNKKNGL